MAHLGCRCGNVMWDGLSPNDIEFTAFSDIRFCELADNPPALFSNPEEFVLDFTDLFELADFTVWRCPECKRLYVFENQGKPTKAKYVYKLEETHDA